MQATLKIHKNKPKAVKDLLIGESPKDLLLSLFRVQTFLIEKDHFGGFSEEGLSEIADHFYTLIYILEEIDNPSGKNDIFAFSRNEIKEKLGFLFDLQNDLYSYKYPSKFEDSMFVLKNFFMNIIPEDV